MADQEALEVLVKTLDSQARSFRVEPEVRRGLPESGGGPLKTGGGGGVRVVAPPPPPGWVADYGAGV